MGAYQFQSDVNIVSTLFKVHFLTTRGVLRVLSIQCAGRAMLLTVAVLVLLNKRTKPVTEGCGVDRVAATNTLSKW